MMFFSRQAPSLLFHIFASDCSQWSVRMFCNGNFRHQTSFHSILNTLIYFLFQLFSHALFFSISVVVHLTLSYVFCAFFNAIGFILANIVNYLIRICFNWWFIRDALKTYPKSLWTQILPNPTL